MVAMGYFDLILYLSHSNQTLAWQPKYTYGMGSSEIWDKYQSFALKCKFHSASPHEILLIFNVTPVVFIPIFNATLVVFIPNFTATHTITSTSFYRHEKILKLMMIFIKVHA